MTPEGKLRLLLVRQFMCIAVVAIAFALVLIFHDYGGVGAILLLIVATRSPTSAKQKCPLCGQPNRCAMAGRHPVGPCWCVSIRLTADMLEAVPTEDRGVRCICAICARALASGVAPKHAMQPTSVKQNTEQAAGGVLKKLRVER